MKNEHFIFSKSCFLWIRFYNKKRQRRYTAKRPFFNPLWWTDKLFVANPSKCLLYICYQMLCIRVMDARVTADFIVCCWKSMTGPSQWRRKQTKCGRYSAKITLETSNGLANQFCAWNEIELFIIINWEKCSHIVRMFTYIEFKCKHNSWYWILSIIRDFFELKTKYESKENENQLKMRSCNFFFTLILFTLLSIIANRIHYQ